jgi:hypothetical protein
MEGHGTIEGAAAPPGSEFAMRALLPDASG